jgi:hypothetical protein
VILLQTETGRLLRRGKHPPRNDIGRGFLFFKYQ